MKKRTEIVRAAFCKLLYDFVPAKPQDETEDRMEVLIINGSATEFYVQHCEDGTFSYCRDIMGNDGKLKGSVEFGNKPTLTQAKALLVAKFAEIHNV